MNEDNHSFCLGFTDVAENTLSSQKQVFPNPNNGQFNLRLHSKNNDLEILDVSIFDHLGRETTKLPENSLNKYNVSLSMDNATTGIYVVRIRTNKGIASKKILVQ